MIEHKLHIGGVEVDLTQPAADIEKIINDNQQKVYLGYVTASYKEIDDLSSCNPNLF